MAREVVENDIKSVNRMCAEVLNGTPCKIARLGGLTNHTYHVWLDGSKEYVVRIPGEGTEEMIVRDDEKKSTLLANKLGIDAHIYFFGPNGEKVSDYISGAVTMDAEKLREPQRIKKVAEILKRLHSCCEDTKVPFEVFDMAALYERIIRDNKVSLYDDYEEIKKSVMSIKGEIDAICAPGKVPCHNDVLCENWVEDKNGRLYLIDWEYAGMNDPYWDLSDISIEAKYSRKEDGELLENYLGKEPSAKEWKHFLANKIYVDYLWTLWAKTRVPFDGQPMEDWAGERYARLKGFIKEYSKFGGER